ncbi:MAG: hypothetical protein GY754_38050 [bacterium]|nr:hypothetical protein [bacterium]
MKDDSLAQSILNLYKTVKDDSNATFATIGHNFSNSKIYEPLVHTSKLFGKVPTNRHILEDQLEEYPF